MTSRCYNKRQKRFLFWFKEHMDKYFDAKICQILVNKMINPLKAFGKAKGDNF